MTSKAMALSYLYNQSDYMRRDLDQLIQNSRIWEPDEVGYLELIVAYVRLSTVDKILSDVYHLIVDLP